jgi:hypothetical protein
MYAEASDRSRQIDSSAAKQHRVISTTPLISDAGGALILCFIALSYEKLVSAFSESALNAAFSDGLPRTHERSLSHLPQLLLVFRT